MNWHQVQIIWIISLLYVHFHGDIHYNLHNKFWRIIFQYIFILIKETIILFQITQFYIPTSKSNYHCSPKTLFQTKRHNYRKLQLVKIKRTTNCWVLNYNRPNHNTTQPQHRRLRNITGERGNIIRVQGYLLKDSIL